MNTTLRIWPKDFPYPWVDGWGEDETGLFITFMVGKVTQHFRWIPPGTFLMGSPDDEPMREMDELQHQVTLTFGYWMADTACTQDFWQQVMRTNPSHFIRNDRPVENVGWLDVQGFIRKLNHKHPKWNLRLPTEAEWEYACRAGTHTPFSFGSLLTPRRVNFDGNFPYARGKKEFIEMEQFPSNSCQ